MLNLFLLLIIKGYKQKVLVIFLCHFKHIFKINIFNTFNHNRLLTVIIYINIKCNRTKIKERRKKKAIHEYIYHTIFM